MAKLKQLYLSSIFYTFANTLEALTPIILIPVLTRFLSPHEYGLWSLFQIVVALLVPLISLSFRDAVRMHYLSLTPEALRIYINSAATIIIFLGMVALFFVLMLQPFLTEWLKIGTTGLIAIVAMTVCYGLFYKALAVFQFANERKIFTIVHVVHTVISITVTFALVLNDSGWTGCVYGRVAGLSSAAMVAGWFLFRKFGCIFPFTISQDVFYDLLAFGWKYLPSGLFVILIPFTNRVFIANFLSVAETSIYAIAESLSMVLGLLVIGYMHAWQPWLFRKLAGHDSHGLEGVRRSCVIFVIALPLIAAAMTFVAHYMIPFVIGEEFQQVDNLLFPLMMVVSGAAYLQLAQTFLHFHKRVDLMSIGSIIAIILNAMFAWFLIPIYGILGAAMAATIAYIIAGVFSLLMVHLKCSLDMEKILG